MVAEPGNLAASPTATPWWRTLLYALLITGVLVAAFLIFEKYFRTAATVVLLAVVLTYLMQPAVDWVARLGRARHAHAARVAAVLVIYVLIGAVIFGMGASIGGTLKKQTKELVSTFNQGRLPAQLERLEAWYVTAIPPKVREQFATRLQEQINKADLSQQAWDWALGLMKHIGRWFGVLIELIVVPIIAFYLLTDEAVVREQILGFVPPRRRNAFLRYGRGIGDIFRKYVQGQIILCAIAWAVVTLAMLVLGIPGALLLGVIAGATRAIPMVGPLVGGVPVVAAVLLHPQSAAFFWPVLIGFTALHLFESKYLMPRVLGDHLGLHPILIIVALLVGYAFLGLLGMFIGPPTVAVIRFILAVRRGEGPFPETEQPALPGIEEPVGEAEAAG